MYHSYQYQVRAITLFLCTGRFQGRFSTQLKNKFLKSIRAVANKNPQLCHFMKYHTPQKSWIWFSRIQAICDYPTIEFWDSCISVHLNGSGTYFNINSSKNKKQILYVIKIYIYIYIKETYTQSSTHPLLQKNDQPWFSLLLMSSNGAAHVCVGSHSLFACILGRGGMDFHATQPGLSCFVRQVSVEYPLNFQFSPKYLFWEM